MALLLTTDVQCSSAEEFLDNLSPIGSRFKDISIDEQWVFRGQAQDWQLLPSALRAEGVALTPYSRRDLRDRTERSLAERDVLIQFFEIADRRGLVLPDDSQQLRSELETLRSSRGDTFVGRRYQDWKLTDAALSLVALAQHYGIPTQLLDWSRQPLTAAFFAAEGAYRLGGSDSSDKLVVWSFFFPLLGKHDSIERLTDPVQVVTAPSATNLNLKAQQGLFTLVNDFYSHDPDGAPHPMDLVLEDYATRMVEAGSPHSESPFLRCRLQKFTLAIAEAPRLLALLGKLDITPSAIYPGYRHIKDDLAFRNALSRP